MIPLSSVPAGSASRQGPKSGKMRRGVTERDPGVVCGHSRLASLLRRERVPPTQAVSRGITELSHDR